MLALEDHVSLDKITKEENFKFIGSKAWAWDTIESIEAIETQYQGETWKISTPRAIIKRVKWS